MRRDSIHHALTAQHFTSGGPLFSLPPTAEQTYSCTKMPQHIRRDPCEHCETGTVGRIARLRALSGENSKALPKYPSSFAGERAMAFTVHGYGMNLMVARIAPNFHCRASAASSVAASSSVLSPAFSAACLADLAAASAAAWAASAAAFCSLSKTAFKGRLVNNRTPSVGQQSS